MGVGRGVVVAPLRAALGECPAAVRVDGDVFHGRKIDHDAVVARRVPRDVVAPAADGDGEPVLSGEVDRRHDVGGAGNGAMIDLGDDGPTPNDVTDDDVGANYLQNFPVINSLKYPNAYPAPNAQNVQAYFFGELDGDTPGGYRMDAYFYNGGCLPGLRGEAAVYLGSFPALIGVGGTKSVFNYVLELPNVAPDAAIAFTATDSNGNTSEMGECFPVSQATLLNSDEIFKDGYEP